MSDTDTEIKVLDRIDGDEDGNGWEPGLSLDHDGRSELYVIIGEEVRGMVEGVSAAMYERLRQRLSPSNP